MAWGLPAAMETREPSDTGAPQEDPAKLERLLLIGLAPLRLVSHRSPDAPQITHTTPKPSPDRKSHLAKLTCEQQPQPMLPASLEGGCQGEVWGA